MFKFGFGETNKVETPQVDRQELLPSSFCTFDSLRAREPRISYTIWHGVPRRDIYDVRFELMRNDVGEEEKLLLSETEDVRKNVYEGGLKVWEGTNDLLEVLQNYDLNTKTMELGCGAGVPSCYRLIKTLQANKPGKFILADYNRSVLEYLTIPNVVLAWLYAAKKLDSSEPELVISAELLSEMLTDLEQRQISVQFVAGAWSPQFLELVGTDYDLVLASETIYSLESLPEFTNVLLGSLSSQGQALVAAKRVYFGVGGGIVEFEKLLEEKKAKLKTVFERGNVGRVVIEVYRS